MCSRSVVVHLESSFVPLGSMTDEEAIEAWNKGADTCAKCLEFVKSKSAPKRAKKVKPLSKSEMNQIKYGYKLALEEQKVPEIDRVKWMFPGRKPSAKSGSDSEDSSSGSKKSREKGSISGSSSGSSSGSESEEAPPPPKQTSAKGYQAHPAVFTSESSSSEETALRPSKRPRDAASTGPSAKRVKEPSQPISALPKEPSRPISALPKEPSRPISALPKEPSRPISALPKELSSSHKQVTTPTVSSTPPPLPPVPAAPKPVTAPTWVQSKFPDQPKRRLATQVLRTGLQERIPTGSWLHTVRSALEALQAALPDLSKFSPLDILASSLEAQLMKAVADSLSGASEKGDASPNYVGLVARSPTVLKELDMVYSSCLRAACSEIAAETHPGEFSKLSSGKDQDWFRREPEARDLDTQLEQAFRALREFGALCLRNADSRSTSVWMVQGRCVEGVDGWVSELASSLTG
jgi:hypothetical protein